MEIPDFLRIVFRVMANGAVSTALGTAANLRVFPQIKAPPVDGWGAPEYVSSWRFWAAG
jgi:hypothetical protein